jgi:A/G-specific adenine glycosylase
LWSVAESILPPRQCGAFNQALMELGSEICTPRAPDCQRCPVATLCAAREQNLVARIPRPPKQTKYEDLTEVAVVIRSGRRVALRRCQPGERWAGLWDFPRFAASNHNGHSIVQSHIAQQTRELTGLSISLGIHFVTLKHGVTRFRITLHCYAATLERHARPKPTNAAQSDAVHWVPIDSLANYPLSVTGRKISRLLAASKS